MIFWKNRDTIPKGFVEFAITWKCMVKNIFIYETDNKDGNFAGELAQESIGMPEKT